MWFGESHPATGIAVLEPGAADPGVLVDHGEADAGLLQADGRQDAGHPGTDHEDVEVAPGRLSAGRPGTRDTDPSSKILSSDIRKSP